MRSTPLLLWLATVVACRESDPGSGGGTQSSDGGDADSDDTDGGDGNDDDGGSGEDAVGEALDAIAEAYCAVRADCTCADSVSEADCFDAAVAALEAQRAAANALGQSFSEDCADARLSAYDTGACAEYTQLTTFQCPLFHGSTPQGAPCALVNTYGDCSEGLVCTLLTLDQPLQPVCVAPPSEGDACSAASSGVDVCVLAGLYCDPQSQTCATPAPLGSACDPAVASCGPFVICDADTMTCRGSPLDDGSCSGACEGHETCLYGTCNSFACLGFAP